MTDIVEFLTARLDEDETAAVRAARPEPWVMQQPARPDWYMQFWADPEDRVAVIADPESSAYPVVVSLVGDDEDLAEGRVEHIARHDPARVLADVAAKRLILAWHASPHTVVAGFCVEEGGRCTHEGESRCEACGFDDGCPTVRLMAAVYATHPDYDQAWKAD